MAERRTGKGSKGRRIRGTSPSAADITKLKRMEASDEAKAHEPSEVDAMGQDKRREVVGHSYGPSRRSQVMFFVAVGLVFVVIFGGYALLVGLFDTIPGDLPDTAPWSKEADTPELQAEQSTKPNAVDTPCGEPGNVYPVPPLSPCQRPLPGATPQSLSKQ